MKMAQRLVFPLLAVLLLAPVAQAQNQTVTGSLTVSGDTTLSGALNVSGVADFNNNVTNFGVNGANAATPGLVLTYTDTVSGTISTITLATSGTSAIWQWERNSANGLIPQMTLTATNSLILWNPTVSNSAAIILNPNGDSTFSGSITATGTNSRLPNQQISTDTASIITKAYADNTYLTTSQAASSYIPIGTTVLSIGYGTSATGSYSTALGYNTIAAGSGQVVIGQYNSPLASEGDNGTNWVSSDALLVVGNGTSDQSRSNALVVGKNGDLTIAGSAAVAKKLNVAGDATFRGIVKIPQQGDLAMGSFTNSGTTRAQTVAEAYFNTLASSSAGKILSDTEKENITSFLTGLDQIVGLDNVVECWTFRNSQNMGSGTVAYGLKGQYNGNLVSSPSWDTAGITLHSCSRISVAGILQNMGGGATFSTAVVGLPRTDWENPWGYGVYVFNESNEMFLTETRFGGINQANFCLYMANPDSSDFISSSANRNMIYAGYTPDQIFIGKNGKSLAVKNSTIPIQNFYSSTLDFGGPTEPWPNYNIANISFSIVFSKKLSDAEFGLIYNLYKSTIGQGLGLP